jgi:phosphate transport system permease protein
MSDETPTRALTRRTEDAPRERIARGFFFVCAVLSVLTTIGIVAALVVDAAKFFRATGWLFDVPVEQTVAAVDFFTGLTWNPTIPPYSFGVVPLVSATLLITLGSALVALPLGVATAIYLSEYASPRARSYLKPALEVLAGVPTVVYGFFAYVYITPVLDVFVGELSSFNALSASIVVGIMIIPMVSSISEDAMSAVPDDLRQASYGMGATKFEVATGVVVPAAISGILSSFILALSRAIGETMAVTVAMGTTPNLMNPLNPLDFLEGGLPMTAAMVNLATGDIAAQGTAYRSLFAIGLTLFAITLLMNVLSDRITARYREAY